MVSLLIVLISIVLVGLLSVATFYYVGDTTDDADKARIARKIAEAAQLHGAMELSMVDGKTDLSMTGLVQNGYLSAPLQDWNENASTFNAQSPITESICMQFNQTQGYTLPTIPACTDPLIASYKRGVCCSN